MIKKALAVDGTTFEVIELTSSYISGFSRTKYETTQYWIKHSCGCHCDQMKCSFGKEIDVIVRQDGIYGVGSKNNVRIIRKVVDQFKEIAEQKAKNKVAFIKRIK
jgi:hypothetical protein